MRNILKTALVIGISVAAAGNYWNLHMELVKDNSFYKQRLEEILIIGQKHWEAADVRKSPSRMPKREKEGRKLLQILMKPLSFPCSEIPYRPALVRELRLHVPTLRYLTAKPLVGRIEELVDEYFSKTERLRLGHILWPAVDERETAGSPERVFARRQPLGSSSKPKTREECLAALM